MASNDYVIHSESEIARIRRAAGVAAAVRERLAGIVRSGMSTKEVDELAQSMIESAGARCAFLGYRGFPGHICVSLNDEVVHGIGRPDKIIKSGDVVSLDIGVLLDGCVGDTATTVMVGECAAEAKYLLRHTELAMYDGIKAARCGNHVWHISEAVERYATSAKLGVVREYVGHGCGLKLHEPPEVPNFKSSKKGPRLLPGMVLAIEPMLNLGTHRVLTEDDGWTVRTSDGKLSAHFEHMVLITTNGPEILTWPKI